MWGCVGSWGPLPGENLGQIRGVCSKWKKQKKQLNTWALFCQSLKGPKRKIPNLHSSEKGHYNGEKIEKKKRRKEEGQQKKQNVVSCRTLLGGEIK